MTEFMLDVAQATELKIAFQRGRWTNAEIELLCQYDTLAELREVMLGNAVITATGGLIDLDAVPFVPHKDWKVEEHQKGGQFKWDASKIKLYQSQKQLVRDPWKGEAVKGNELREELKSRIVYNANLLYHLLKNPHLIPEKWKGHRIYFWGTIYRDSHNDKLYVLGLSYYEKWKWTCSEVEDWFVRGDATAVSVQNGAG